MDASEIGNGVLAHLESGQIAEVIDDVLDTFKLIAHNFYLFDVISLCLGPQGGEFFEEGVR